MMKNQLQRQLGKAMLWLALFMTPWVVQGVAPPSHENEMFDVNLFEASKNDAYSRHIEISNKLAILSWQAYTYVSTFTGTGFGFQDGGPDFAQFYDPRGVAVDASGNVYVADMQNHSIRKVTSEGVVSTLAGNGSSGFQDGQGSSARFNQPYGIVVDASGNVYVADTQNHRIRKITSEGVVSTLAGSGSSGFQDGQGTSASFSSPQGVTVDGSGNVYVADTGNHRIRKIKSDGTVSTFAGNGSGTYQDGIGTLAGIPSPYHLTIDNSGNLYVTSEHKVLKIASDGATTTLAGGVTAGYQDGNSATAQFKYPAGLDVDADGNVYVSDAHNHRVRRILPDGTVGTLAGDGTDAHQDGIGAFARFDYPIGIAVDASGNLFITDSENHRIRKIEIGNVGLSTATSQSVDEDNSLQLGVAMTDAEDDEGDPLYLIIEEGSNYTVSNDSTLTPTENFYGTLTAPIKVTDGTDTSFTVDMTVTVNPINDDPSFISVPETTGSVGVLYEYEVEGSDPDGDYISYKSKNELPSWLSLESGNEIIVDTLAGSKTGLQGFQDGFREMAKFSVPWGITTDDIGNVYVTDYNNYKVRKITPNGTVTTLAGSTQGFADGASDDAKFNLITDAAVDAAGNVYIADKGNHRIRVISNGTNDVSTIAGGVSGGSFGFIFGDTDGDKSVAQFYEPSGIAVTSTGDTIYVADSYNNKIRRIIISSGDTTVSTLAGDGTTSIFNYPNDVALDTDGNLYVSDKNNHRIQKVTASGTVSTLAGSGSMGMQDGSGNAASFWNPHSVEVGPLGNIYVADHGNSRLRKVSSTGTVSTILESLDPLANPTGVGISDSGIIYVVASNRNQIIRFAPGAPTLKGTPTISDVGVHPVTLELTDGTVTVEQPFTITIAIPNEVPTLSSTTAQEVDEDNSLQLSVSMTDAADADDDPLFLIVENGTNYTVSDSTITPTANYYGTLTVPLKISDGTDTTAAVNMTVTVNPINDAPILTSATAQLIEEDEDLELEISMTDALDVDGDALTFIIGEGDNYTISGDTITPTTNFHGELTVPLQVSDGIVTTDAVNMKVTVVSINDVPTLTLANDQVIEMDNQLEVSVSMTDAADPDGDDLNIILENGSNYTVSDSTLTPSTGFTGELTVPVKVTDGTVTTATVDMKVTVVPPNNLPTFTTVTDQEVDEDNPLQLSVTMTNAADADGDLLYLIVEDGDNYTVSDSTITPILNFNGTLTVPVKVFDGIVTTAAIDMTVTVNPVNDAPTLTMATPQTIDEDNALEILISMTDAADVDGDELSLIVEEGENYTVSGATITPAADFHGELTVPLKVTDGSETTDAVDMTVTINPVQDDPIVDKPLGDLEKEEGFGEKTIDLDTVFSDPDGDDLTITVTSSDESVATVKIVDGKLVITEVGIGTTTITITVDDGKGGVVTTSFVLVIKAVVKVPEYTEIPQGISPGSADRLNDIWEIPGIQNFPNNKVIIFNRWGDKVFEVSGYDNENKAFQGKSNLGPTGLLPDGTYYYLIDFGNGIERKSFLIIR